MATIGLAVPQANSIVEPEMRALMPDGVNLLTTRLRGSTTDSRDRLTGYFETLGDTLAAFDVAPIDAVAYACTASSYLAADEDEAERLAAHEDWFGYPIVTATTALRLALHRLAASSIAIVAPYPDWLADRCIAYWQRRGFDVIEHRACPMDAADTRSTYGLHSSIVEKQLADMDLSNADAVVVTGTGLPTLAAIGALTQKIGLPVISSNLCLAWATLRAAGAADALSAERPCEPLMGGWHSRLRA